MLTENVESLVPMSFILPHLSFILLSKTSYSMMLQCLLTITDTIRIDHFPLPDTLCLPALPDKFCDWSIFMPKHLRSVLAFILCTLTNSPGFLLPGFKNWIPLNPQSISINSFVLQGTSQMTLLMFDLAI